jgi:hypothetical protein
MVVQLYVVPGGWPEHILWLSLLTLIVARGPGAISNRPSNPERPIFVARVGAERSSLDLYRTTKPPASKVAAFASVKTDVCLLSEPEPNCNFIVDRPAAW